MFRRVVLTLGICLSVRAAYGITYETDERGTPNTVDYKLYIKNENGIVSPFHDIPLLADTTGKVFNMVVEIPRWTNAKMEINKESILNPIQFDIKDDQIRFVSNIFPYKGYIWNYGAFPQTWENSTVLDKHTGFKGDNDPLDVLEIGNKVAKPGEVFKVKVLGTIGLVDSNETDWKVYVINVDDPHASKINDLKDIETHFPGLLKATVEWFKIYKIPDGKPENKFAFDSEPKDAEFALQIINTAHEHWKSLTHTRNTESTKNISCVNTTLKNAFTIDNQKVQEILKNTPVSKHSPPLPKVDEWKYVKRNTVIVYELVKQ